MVTAKIMPPPNQTKFCTSAKPFHVLRHNIFKDLQPFERHRKLLATAALQRSARAKADRRHQQDVKKDTEMDSV